MMNENWTVEDEITYIAYLKENKMDEIINIVHEEFCCECGEMGYEAYGCECRCPFEELEEDDIIKMYLSMQ